MSLAEGLVPVKEADRKEKLLVDGTPEDCYHLRGHGFTGF